MTRESGFKQRVRARMASTGERYAAARAHLDQGPPTLHLTNGESAAMGLRAAGLDGAVGAWTDDLIDRPVRSGQRPPLELKALDYVLWFEADLYDQLLLVQLLDRLAGLRVSPERVTLISIGEYRGMAHFGGLGELAPEALAGLRPQGLPLQAENFALARAAWRAFTAGRPRRLPTIARAESRELRFQGEAFARLMQEYPSRVDGLSLTERRILQAVEEGAATRREVFAQVWRRERRPFLGDTTCFRILERLLAGAHPLLASRGEDDRLRLTPIGRKVLAGGADQVRLNGIDRWVGGVHLAAGEPDWRYDERLETVTEAG